MLLFRFNPLQVQTKLDKLLDRQRTWTEFQSPIGTNKTMVASSIKIGLVLVSIPYRYKQNRFLLAYLHSFALEFQSPIGTNKTVQRWQLQKTITMFQSPIGTNKTVTTRPDLANEWHGFNPLQVQTKHIKPARHTAAVILFQSPIGTNKTLPWSDIRCYLCCRFNPLQVQTKPQNEKTVKYPKTLLQQGF